MLKKSARLLHLIGDKAPPAARDSDEVARALNQHCYSHIVNGGRIWCLSSRPSLSLRFPIQEEAMDVSGSAPRGSLPCGRYLLAPLTGKKEGSMGFMVL